MPRNVIHPKKFLCWQNRQIRQFDLVLAREDQVRRAAKGYVLRLFNNPAEDRWILDVTPVKPEEAIATLSLRGAYVAQEKLDELVAAGTKKTSLVILWLERIDKP
jgi:hypothetical protein